MEISDQLHPQATLIPVLGVCVGFRAGLDIAGENKHFLPQWLSRSQPCHYIRTEPSPCHSLLQLKWTW